MPTGIMTKPSRMCCAPWHKPSMVISGPGPNYKPMRPACPRRKRAFKLRRGDDRQGWARLPMSCKRKRTRHKCVSSSKPTVAPLRSPMASSPPPSAGRPTHPSEWQTRPRSCRLTPSGKTSRSSSPRRNRTVPILQQCGPFAAKRGAATSNHRGSLASARGQRQRRLRKGLGRVRHRERRLCRGTRAAGSYLPGLFVAQGRGGVHGP